MSVDCMLISILSVSVKALEMPCALVAEALAPQACDLKADDFHHPPAPEDAVVGYSFFPCQLPSAVGFHQQPLFQCHFFLSWNYFLLLPPLANVFLHSCLLPPGLLFPLLLLQYLLPLSGLPLLPPPLDICLCATQLKFRNTVSRNFYLPHSSAFLWTYCQIISSSVFVKNKILKYKVSQLQLKTALDNCKQAISGREQALCQLTLCFELQSRSERRK